MNKNDKKIKKNNNMKVNSVVKEKARNKKKKFQIDKCLKLTMYITLMILISLVSFIGVYVKNKNQMENKIPEYKLGSDIDGLRNIVIKVDDSTTTKTYDANGNEVSNNTTEEGTTTQEIPVNDESTLTTDNYDKIKEIIEARLKYMNIDYYEIKYNQTDGTINLEVPEDSNTDYIAQYCITKGEFKVTDNDTGDVLLSNADVKEAKIGYDTQTSGTTVYLDIKFNKEGTEKLKDISSTYVQTTTQSNTTDDENTETEENSTTDTGTTTTTKKIKMTLDDETIMTTYFDEQITNGDMQLSLGTSTDSSKLQEYVKQASNVAVLLNTDAMPITYTMSINRLVYSDITNQELMIIIIVLSSIYVLLLIYMIIKYKKTGFLAAITSMGFVALLLLIIRYANVELTLSGIFAIFGSSILEYIILFNILKTYKKDLDIETKQKEMKKTINIELEKLIPVVIIAIVFSIVKWQTLYSVGMILFWGVLEALIYNLITIKIICGKEGK